MSGQEALIGGDGTATGPVVIMSYLYSGADSVQALLAAGTQLACTQATGIIPLCGMAAETWRRVERARARASETSSMSRMAVLSLRRLVNSQVTMLLAEAGKRRWCELATAPPAAYDQFFQVFPEAAFVCVHRSCVDVVRAVVQESPFVLRDAGLMRYAVAYPGNNLAAIAAYWAASTQLLLEFEEANPKATCRIRYEDVVADRQVIDAVRESLHIWSGDGGSRGGGLPPVLLPATDDPGPAGFDIPIDMIPASLRDRIDALSARLRYEPLVA